MRISYLELRNYRRFRELKLQFPDGIVGILGMNGSGKTTVIESIAWALFGNVDEVVRTSREGVRWSGAQPSDRCSAVLEFELAGTEYRVFREMAGKNLTMKAELRTKGMVLAEGDRPVKEKVEQLLGMDHKSFFTSVFARQKELNALQGISAAERKRTVLRMLRIDAIDTVVERVRRDKRDRTQKIEGASRTLLDQDGREREKVISERLPGMASAHEEAERTLTEAEERERLALGEYEAARRTRDQLKGDYEAFNDLSKDLGIKLKGIEEGRKREERILARLNEAKAKLQKLPGLERQDAEWNKLSKQRDQLEGEKSRSEKARHIEEDIRAAERDEAARLEDLGRMTGERADPSQMVAEIDRLEKEKGECERQRAELSGRMGELKARKAERLQAAEKDRKKLGEITAAGKEGVCPTCERTLGESYELLVRKLGESAAEAAAAAEGIESTVAALQAQDQGLANKVQGIAKKRKRLDEDLARLKELEASIRSGEKELRAGRERLTLKRKELAALGEIKFSDSEYANVRSALERLKPAHDEYVRVRESESLVRSLARELEETRELIRRNRLEEEGLRASLEKLEPKKNQYSSMMAVLDQKTAALSAAKDDCRKLMAARDKSRGELESARRELESIAKVKKDIEGDRKAVDELSLLEDVVIGFKDNLIARVAPTLAELTSRNLESMSGGKYSRVELDESYEMHIDDQGVQYPVSRFSGGESDLANLSLRLAISGIIAERTGAAPVNFLILDEIFGSQDPGRKRSVMAALSRLSAQFRQIFLITHIEDVKDAMSYVINVQELEDGTSRAWLVP